MKTGFRFQLIVIGCILAGCLIGAAGASTLGTDWKERPSTESPFLGVTITPSASVVYAGGNQMFVRTWDREKHWGGRSGQVAAMSMDGNHVVTSLGNTVVLLDKDGVEDWSRTMGGLVRAVAISPNGSFMISADDQGNYNSWNLNGELNGRNKNLTTNKIAIAPTSDLVIVLTEKGLRFYDRKLALVWYDNRTESRDEFVAISGDGSTVITAGYNQVASYTRDGTLNWRREITKDPIIDMKCSFDCSAIIVAGQDKNIVALDRHGVIRWTYPAEQWVNAVGVSRDASVIAAGGIDRNLYVLDHSGTLITKKKMDAIIQPGSIAVSSDGKRIVVADQINLYGFSLIGDAVAPDVPVTMTQPPLNPVPTTNPTRTATTPPVTTPATVPVTTATQKSALTPLVLVPAISAAVLLIRRQR